MTLSFNKNIKNISPYYIEVLKENIQRAHSNETSKPIFDYDILMKNIDKLYFYPENKSIELVNLASKFYKIEQNNIIATNGSDEGIDLCIRTFCNIGDTILVVEPTFSMYKQYAIAFGLKVQSVGLKENDFSWSFDENELIKTAKESNVKMIFIPNPLADVGSLVEKNKLLNIIQSLSDKIVVIDEAYIEFCGLENSMLDELKNYQNLVILRTFSKFFGLAGIRLGFIFTNFQSEIMKIKSPYNVNTITCQIGINVFNNIKNDIIKQRQNEILQKRIELEKWLKTFIEVDKIFKSDTNFLFVKLNCKASIFADKLEKEFKIKVKVMSGKFENYCRISVL